MPEEPELPEQPSDTGEQLPKAAEEVPAESDQDADRLIEEAAGSPSEADRLAEEQMLAQMAEIDGGISDGAAVDAPPSEADRIAEEQMLAQMAEAEALDGIDHSAMNKIKAPSMDFDRMQSGSVMAQTAEFPQLGTTGSAGEARSFDLLMDVKLPVSIELGRTTMAIADILALGGGSIVELDKLAGEPVDLLVNDKIIAQGEVVVVDENFGIRITTLVSPQDRIKSL